MSKAERTKQFIVEKTAPIFNMKGFAGTSLSDITEATGLTKGSIYGNFANKDEVALAVFDYNLSLLSKGINVIVSGSTNAIDTLLKMADFYRSQFKNTLTAGGCPILNTAIDADDTHPLLKEKASKSIKAWKKNIESIIKQGIAKNEVKSTVNAAEFATEYISLIEGGIMLAKTTGDVSMLNTCISRVEKIINSELKL
ncbi:MAG: TetR/AcrR family transcriptional regulator [Segetibacter sp.]|nr:TetR/AcrR family transcriptional regulator [Segetibacter sp.]